MISQNVCDKNKSKLPKILWFLELLHNNNTATDTFMLPQDLNMRWDEIWSADRVGTTLRTRGWHQHAAPWRRSRGSPDAQWFHSGCWTDTNRGGRHIWGCWLDAARMRNTSDWPHTIITWSELSRFAPSEDPSPRAVLCMCCGLHVCALNGFYLLRGCCSLWCSFTSRM